MLYTRVVLNQSHHVPLLEALRVTMFTLQHGGVMWADALTFIGMLCPPVMLPLVVLASLGWVLPKSVTALVVVIL